MSLNPQQRAETAEDFTRAIKAASVSVDEIEQECGLCPADFQSAFTLTGHVNPVHVWLVRDVIESEAKARGYQATFRHLPEHMRSAARMWFGVEDNRY
ncbi:MAG: DUF2316 family protein [Rothia sp. (in: high G+C Gram-positive bacteria)]|uniref:DUF2316 family protein n=1 Tax=Rothia sp. (in: high G+C Gram-positive bacteria) TaxID=1885016 RepID=UPI0026E0C8CF|nr:DUF2316 family protein [Rothia sp. (in: high G+C Gram-positive bacteria)]MDO5749986.1 DUF2316 family protein [Rothia sp. (in: high G+C Gram-positive bacteria)]